MVFENDEQRQGFASLSAKQKRKFEDIEEDHPNWSYSQIMAKIAIDSQGDKWLESMDGGQVNGPEDLSPDVWEAILVGAKTVLQNVKGIGYKIIVAFDAAISTIKTWIIAGLSRVGNRIGKLLGGLFG